MSFDSPPVLVLPHEMQPIIEQDDDIYESTSLSADNKNELKSPSRAAPVGSFQSKSPAQTPSKVKVKPATTSIVESKDNDKDKDKDDDHVSSATPTKPNTATATATTTTTAPIKPPPLSITSPPPQSARARASSTSIPISVSAAYPPTSASSRPHSNSVDIESTSLSPKGTRRMSLLRNLSSKLSVSSMLGNSNSNSNSPPPPSSGSVIPIPSSSSGDPNSNSPTPKRNLTRGGISSWGLSMSPRGSGGGSSGSIDLTDHGSGLSAVGKVQSMVSGLTDVNRKKRELVEKGLIDKKSREIKKQADYQSMIGKYKLRSVSISVDADETNTTFFAQMVNNAALKIIDNNYIIRPENNLVRFWDVLIMILVVWQSLYVPVVLTFDPKIPHHLWVFDKIGDIMFIMDFLLQFNVGRYNKQGVLQTTRLAISYEYVTGNYGAWFVIDLSASFPFDWATIGLLKAFSYSYYINGLKESRNESSNSNSYGSVKLIKILRLPRLLRLLKLFRLLKAFKRFEKLQRFLKYSRYAHLFKLITQITIILITCHYGACLWYQVAGPNGSWFTYECIEIAEHCYDTVRWNTTEAQIGCIEYCDLSNLTAFELGSRFSILYTTAYFAIVAIMTAGENMSPVTTNEKFWSVVFTLTGSILMAIVFGEVAVLISNFYARQSRYQTKMEYLFESMKRMGLPPEIEQRVYSYYDYIHEAHGTLNGKTTAFIPELSKKLAAEVLMYLRMDMIHQVPFFQNISPEVVQQLVLKLTLQVFLPKEYIVVRGEVGDEMYFIQDGECEVTIPFKDLPQSKKDELLAQKRAERMEADGTKSRKGSTFSVSGTFGRVGRRESSDSGRSARSAMSDENRSFNENSAHSVTRANSFPIVKTVSEIGAGAGAGAGMEGKNEDTTNNNNNNNSTNDHPSIDSQTSNSDIPTDRRDSRKKSLLLYAKKIIKNIENSKVEAMEQPILDSELIDFEREHVLATLLKGAYFGEIALVMMTKRTANVRAKGFCELCGLNRDVYNKVVAVYFEDKQSMEGYIMTKYGKSENVQTAYNKGGLSGVGAVGFEDVEEGLEEDEEDELSAMASGLGSQGSGTQSRSASSRKVVTELKEQTASMKEYITGGVQGMQDKIDVMMELQKGNKKRMEDVKELMEKLTKVKEGGKERGVVEKEEGTLL